MTDLKTYYANAAIIYSRFMIKPGVKSCHALGLLTQADAESSLRALVVGDHGTAFGLFQEHEARVAAIKAGCGIDMHTASIPDQCDGVWWELTHTEKAALAHILAAKTAYDAAYAACRYFERPASTAQYAKRGDKAEQWAVYFSKHPVA